MPSESEPSSSTTLNNDLRQEFEKKRFKGPLQDAQVISIPASGSEEEEFEDVQIRAGFWRRVLMTVRKRKVQIGQFKALPTSSVEDVRKKEMHEGKEGVMVGWRFGGLSGRWGKGVVGLVGALVMVMCFFGLVHVVNVSLSYVRPLNDDLPSSFLNKWSLTGEIISRPENPTRGVTPINCHSHNDYWRRIPLYEALGLGCTGVEVDVWFFDEELFVGHNTHALTLNRTFRTMYVDPLTALLDKRNTIDERFNETPLPSPRNGIFEEEPLRTLVLLVDYKNNGPAIHPFVSSQLAALRDKQYLTYSNGETVISGPITVVATGNAPFDLLTQNTTFRDIFFDAPLDRLYEEPSTTTNLLTAPVTTQPKRRTRGQGAMGTTSSTTFDSTNSYYASVSFKKSIGFLWFGKFSDTQLQRIRGQVQGAKKRGLKTRYWGAPTWPVGLRNRVWQTLVDEGVDYLSGDDLVGMVRGDWGARWHRGWFG